MILERSDFHAYAYSNLLNNTTRGHLAEYMVALALGIDTSIPREEWAPWDLTTTAGVRVEVKSSAYRQAWHQSKKSAIRFSIAESQAWDAKTARFEPGLKRHAQVYVFALFERYVEGEAPNNDALLDPAHWRFWVLPTSILNSKCERQKTLGLGSLRDLVEEQYKEGLTNDELGEAVTTAFKTNSQSPVS